MNTIEFNIERIDDVPFLHFNHLHIWYLNIGDHVNLIHDKYFILSNEERIQAEKFVYQKDFQCFSVSHILLRLLLAKYLDTDPIKLIIKSGKWQKPYIDREPLVFNLSHTADVAMIGISKAGLLGLDVEYINPNYPKDLIGSFMNDEEEKYFMSLDSNDKCNYFHQCWTCKEAFVKAIGMGLSFPLKQIHTGFKRNNEFGLLKIHNARFGGELWFSHSLVIDANYAVSAVTNFEPVISIITNNK